MSFIDKLAAAVEKKGSPVLVGLDPRFEWIPESLKQSSLKDLNEFSNRLMSLRSSEDDQPTVPGFEESEIAPTIFCDFCREIIDIVAPYVPCVKPQMAFFEQLGPDGMVALDDVIDYARENDLLVLLDGKRNDIGTTAAAYAKGMLGKSSPWSADALTISPYLGDDSLEPFIQTAVEQEAGLFILVKTSNPGGGMIQNLEVRDGRKIYEVVGDYVQSKALETIGNCGYGAVGAVVGATYPTELAQLRQRMPNTWFLIPGFGAQGGSAQSVAAAFDDKGLGAVVNNSRGINFAWRTKAYESFGEVKWKDAVLAATKDMCAALKEVIRN